jgi:hypothetical protein
VPVRQRQKTAEQAAIEAVTAREEAEGQDAEVEPQEVGALVPWKAVVGKDAGELNANGPGLGTLGFGAIDSHGDGGSR